MRTTEQVPGVYRRMVGGVLVTALSDGHVIFPPGLLQNISQAQCDTLMHAAGRRPPFASAVNAFLLQWAGRAILVDTGAGSLMAPTTGKLIHNMQEAGVSPAEIDAVLITHLHIDHFGGLIDGDGAAVFPHAELVVPEAELVFWSSDANRAAAPEARRGSFDTARRTIARYADRLRRFSGTEPLPGIEALPLPGHTPGHTGYFVGNDDERLLIWGDILHVPEVQSAHPAATLPFDTDQALAAKTRREILERAAREDLLVTGMHMHFPGFARIARSGQGFTVQPEIWRGTLA